MKCFTKPLWAILALYLFGPILCISNATPLSISNFNKYRLSRKLNELNSEQEFIDVNFSFLEQRINFYHPIGDHAGSRVGLRIAGPITGHLWLLGGTSNTFTGDFVISNGSGASLQKHGGAIAIQGNVLLKRNSHITLDFSNQISATSTVRLEDSAFNLWSYTGNVGQSLHRLFVYGDSVVDLDIENRGYKNSLYLDDIINRL